jgi:hypothetical protein
MSTSSQPPAQNQPYPLPVPGPAPVKTGKRGNGLGIAALIVGGFALIGAFIPILNYVAGFVGLVGLVLGIIALCLKNRKKGFAVAGTIVSAIAIVLSIILAITYTAGFAGLIGDAVKTAEAKSSEAANKEISVVYEVNGTATDASIVYSTYTAGTNGTEQSTGQALPFIKESRPTALRTRGPSPARSPSTEMPSPSRPPRARMPRYRAPRRAWTG